MLDDLKRLNNKARKVRLIWCVVLLFVMIGLFVLLLVENDFDYMSEDAKWFDLLFALPMSVHIICVALQKPKSQKQIEKFCKSTTEPTTVTLNRLEQMWNEGADFKYGKVDSEYIISASGLGVVIIPLKDVVWLHSQDVSVEFVPTGSTMYVWYKDGTSKRLTLWGKQV